MSETGEIRASQFVRYEFPKNARGCSAGPALAMQPISHTKGIFTVHPSRLLRERKNGRATTR